VSWHDDLTVTQQVRTETETAAEHCTARARTR